MEICNLNINLQFKSKYFWSAVRPTTFHCVYFAEHSNRWSVKKLFRWQVTREFVTWLCGLQHWIPRIPPAGESRLRARAGPAVPGTCPFLLSSHPHLSAKERITTPFRGKKTLYSNTDPLKSTWMAFKTHFPLFLWK